MKIEPLTIKEILEYHDPDEDKISINTENQTVTLDFRYPYEIDLDRIMSERDLLAWTLHLSGKNWMTGSRLHHFITKVGRYKGFSIYDC